MRMCGIRISVAIFLLFVLSNVKGQSNCLDINNTPFSNQCGDLKITTSNSEFEFCEGFEGKISIDPSLLTVFDSFFIYWCDGNEIDSFANTKFEFSNTYDFPDDMVCGNPYRVIQIDIIAKKNCPAGISYANAATKIKVNKTPIPRFTYSNKICISDSTLFSNKSCYATSYMWDFGDGNTSNKASPYHKYTNTGKYKVRLKASNSCGSNTLEKTIEQDIEVVGYPNAVVDVSLNARDSVVCLNERVTFIDKSNQWSVGNQWKYPSGDKPLTEKTNWKLLDAIIYKDTISYGKKDSVHFIDTVVIDFLKTGTYTFMLTSKNECGNAVWTFPIKVDTAPIVSLTGDTICDTKKYIPNSTISGNTLSTTWSFPGGMPSSSTNKIPGQIMYPPGNNVYKVILDVLANCGNFHLERDLVVVAMTNVKINLPNKQFCKGGENDTLTANVPGGTWSGTGIIDKDLGIFSPKNLSAGKFKVKYKYGIAGCESEDEIEIQVVDAEAVTVSDVIKCEDAGPFMLTAMPNDGLWRGNYLTQPNLFNPDSSGVGLFKVFYDRTDQNGCTITKEVNINIQALPAFSLKDSSTFCADGGPILLTSELVDTVIPYSTNTQFFINNMAVPNNYNLFGLSPGLYFVEAIHQQGECTVSDTGRIHIIAKKTLLMPPNDTLCINDGTFQLTASPSGGTWSGPGVNPITGVINLNVAKGGVKMYNYVFEKGTSCEVSGSVNIKINDPANSLDIGQDETFCFGPTTKALTANVPNGTWSGTGIQPGNGIIDLTLLKTDTTYTYQYCINDSELNNCPACKQKKITILSLPQAAFIKDSTNCIGEVITFTNTTPTGSYDPATVRWNFGNGNTSNLDPIVTQSYAIKNNYTVTLTLKNYNGCSNTYSQTIRVTTKPTVGSNLMLPASACAPFTVSALNLSSADGAFTSYWILNGKRYDTQNFGPITIDSLLDVKHYTLSLYTTNECGTVSESDTFSVRPYPRVDFGIDSLQGCSPLRVRFSNTTKGRPTSFLWDMGNGITSTDSLPSAQTYTTNDTTITQYKIRLIAQNECGSDTLVRWVKVFPPNVRAFIESPQNDVCQYDSLTFLAYSTPGATNTWQIVSPTGKVAGISGDTAVIRFEESGRYKILLYAANCGVHADSTYVNVIAAPQLSFKIPDFACMNDTVYITNTSPNLAGSYWDFGDGSFSNESSPRHVYKTPGFYTITLTGWSLINNCDYSTSQEIKIVGKPTSSFTAGTFNGCQPLPIQFINQSQNGLLYQWDFGDGSGIATDKDPRHTFEKSGTFVVSLTVYDENNCFTDTAVVNVIIHPKPVADFTFEDKKYCLGYDSLVVYNTSSGAAGYVWKFQNQVDTVIHNRFWPTAFGNFDIELTATSDRNCKDTVVKNINILPSPKADFAVDNASGCEDLRVSFQNNSLHSDRYIWYFGNGVSSVNKDTSYVYTSHGIYTASLVAINDNGCPQDTLTREITVHPKPLADFDFAKDKECGVPMHVVFTNQTTFYNDAQWLINGAPASQDLNFDYTFIEDKTYDITLLVENEFYCKDTAQNQVNIYHQPIANFNVTSEACEREEVIIENLSQHAKTYTWTIDGKGNTNVSSPLVIFDEAGQYHIRLIAIYNGLCQDTLDAAVPITVYTKPIADFDYTTGYNNAIKGEVQFRHLARDFTDLLWHFGDGFTSDSLNPMHEYDINRPIRVVLYAYNHNSGLYTCTDSIAKSIEPEWIKTFYAPNALVPDHADELIKVFKPVGVGMAKYHLSIFSPWGEKVWESSALNENGSPTEAWDGKYGGQIVAQGAYTWRADIKWQDGNAEKVLVGSVVVVR